MKKWGIGFGLVLVGTVLIGVLFRMHWASCTVLGTSGCVLVPVWHRIRKRDKDARDRYYEMTVYIELLLCSFKRVGHLKLALSDCQSVFREDSTMGRAIAKAIHILESGECTGNEAIAEGALGCISEIYNSRRMNLIHHFLCWVDRMGGNAADALDVLLADFEMWKRRLMLYQKKKQLIGRECMMATFLALLLCLVSHLLIPENVLPDIEKNPIYQISTLVVLCAMMGALTVIRSCVGQMQPEGKNEKNLTRKVEREFPYWLLAVTIYLGQDSLYHALQQSREETTGRFREEVDHLLDAIYQQPASLEPYMEFFKDLDLPELQTGMKMLYAVNNNGYQDTSRQMQFLVEQSHVIMDRSENHELRMKLAGVRMLRQIPMMFAGMKVVVDILIFFVILAGRVQFWNGG